MLSSKAELADTPQLSGNVNGSKHSGELTVTLSPRVINFYHFCMKNILEKILPLYNPQIISAPFISIPSAVGIQLNVE